MHHWDTQTRKVDWITDQHLQGKVLEEGEHGGQSEILPYKHHNWPYLDAFLSKRPTKGKYLRGFWDLDPEKRCLSKRQKDHQDVKCCQPRLHVSQITPIWILHSTWSLQVSLLRGIPWLSPYCKLRNCQPKFRVLFCQQDTETARDLGRSLQKDEDWSSYGLNCYSEQCQRAIGE